MNRKSWVVSSVGTGPPRMGDVKVQDSVAENASGTSAKLSSIVRTIFEHMQISMKPLHSVKCSVLNAIEAIGYLDKDISHNVLAVICDPPYNTSRISELSSLEHCRLSL